MPRPTPAQLVYGSAVILCATPAMLLAIPEQSGLGAVLIAIVALALGTLVAVASPATGQAKRGQRQRIASPLMTRSSGAEPRLQQTSLRR